MPRWEAEENLQQSKRQTMQTERQNLKTQSGSRKKPQNNQCI